MPQEELVITQHEGCYRISWVTDKPEIIGDTYYYYQDTMSEDRSLAKRAIVFRSIILAPLPYCRNQKDGWRGIFFESEAIAQQALAIANNALKEFYDPACQTYWPNWAVTAFKNGWKLPEDWNPANGWK